MDFISLILILFLFYIRPQDWGLDALHPIQLVSGMVLLSLISRKQGLKLKDFFQTPHDWIIFSYFAWSIYASPTPLLIFKTISGHILFYVVGVQALTTLARLKTFLAWWAWLIMAIASLALLSEFGIDPLGSHDLTEGLMRGRLCLNLQIYNNPNALAHAIVPIFPMLYFLVFWKRVMGKATFVLMAIPFWCIFLTQSKGAFMSTFVTIVATLTFGRPKAVQAAILVISMTVGITALYTLPRMQELNRSKTDQAIQGRVAAFRFGLESMHRYWFGLGWGRFPSQFFRYGPLVKDKPHEKPHHYMKATHSSYNQNGAELGYPGFFMFIGIMYACMRTLITAKTRNDDEERIRRMLFALVISYYFSSWMVDFFYRVTFFLMVAAVGAFHRHLMRVDDGTPETEEEEPKTAIPWRGRLQPVLQTTFAHPHSVLPASAAAVIHPSNLLAPEKPGWEGVLLRNQMTAEQVPAIRWRRFGVVDYAIIWGLTWCAIRMWVYLIGSM